MIKYTRVISTKDDHLDALCSQGGYPEGYTEVAASIKADLKEDLKTWPIDFIGISTAKASHLQTDENLVKTTRTSVAFLFLGQWFYRIVQIYKHTVSGFNYVESEVLMAINESHNVFSLDEQRELAISLLHGEDATVAVGLKIAA